MKRRAVTILFPKSIIFFFFIVLQQVNINAQEGNLPPLNAKIIKYVKTVIGTQVDRGECWDLANQALNRNNADWDHEYKYGKPVDPKKDEILPGDIIQFKKVKVSYTIKNTVYKENMEHHTAIVYKVIAPGKYEIAHQNTGFSGRKVGVSTLDLSTVKKGKMFFYRPVEMAKK